MTDTISRAAALAVISDVGLRHGITGMPLSFVAAADAIRALPAIAASQPADPAVKADSCQRVTVKPLVWTGEYRPVSSPQHYQVWSDNGGSGAPDDPVEIFDGFMLFSPTMTTLGIHRNIEAAKAAAQADYERRILAAIETQPDPRDAVIKLTSEDVTWITDSLRDYRIAVSRGPWDAEPMQRMLAEIDDLIDRYVAAAKGGAA